MLYETSTKKFCSRKCVLIQRTRNSPNKDNLQTYRKACKFNFSLNSYPDRFNFSLIGQYGWYSPSNKKNNMGGVSRDHMLSVRDGFQQGIPPEIISHPANCQLLRHCDNISKNKKSVITYEQLLERIKSW
jgi:hypothetical protein